MDKSDGLAITKEQAQVMLPVVQDSIAKKELTSDAKNKLLEKLTAEQKKFIDDAASRMQNKPERSQPPEEQKKKANESGKRSDASDGATAASGKGNEADQGNKSGTKGQGGNQERPGRNGGGTNAGQQLVELLQSRVK